MTKRAATFQQAVDKKLNKFTSWAGSNFSHFNRNAKLNLKRF
jgi:hypothetical protein